MSHNWERWFSLWRQIRKHSFALAGQNWSKYSFKNLYHVKWINVSNIQNYLSLVRMEVKLFIFLDPPWIFMKGFVCCQSFHPSVHQSVHWWQICWESMKKMKNGKNQWKKKDKKINDTNKKKRHQFTNAYVTRTYRWSTWPCYFTDVDLILEEGISIRSCWRLLP